jgi:hypothetical protein
MAEPDLLGDYNFQTSEEERALGSQYLNMFLEL